MRQTIILLFVAAAFAACNNSDKDTKASDTKVAAATDQKMDYAYTIEHPDQWDPGNKENTKMVLASLKAYETGNLDAALKDFADSVDIKFDGQEGKMSKDSIKAMFTDSWKHMKAMQIDMNDFESVKSRVTGVEYVSMWYKQKWQDMKGGWDSLSVMDDCKIKDGKITELDEKIRHFGKKK
jgi:hypothetical protein